LCLLLNTKDAHEFLNYLLNEVAEKLEKQQRGAEASGGASSIPNPGASIHLLRFPF
jgi:hypothetical protein